MFGGLGLILSSAFYLPMTLLAPIEPVTAHVQAVAVPATDAVELDWPGYGASAIGAIGFDVPLATGGEAGERPIASITKIVTALVVLDEHPLAAGEAGPELTFTSADVALRNKYAAANGRVATVWSGLRLSQREALEVMLVRSANNYAESLATWAFGSEPAFVERARGWLAEHGLDGITIVDSTGMSPGNTATPAELIELGELALANPVIAEIVAMPYIDVPGIGRLPNGNLLLGTAGVDGIKTGTLTASGANLLFSADREVGDETVTLVGAVLGAADHEQLARDVKYLLETAVAGFEVVTLAEAGDVVGDYTTEWGDKARIVVAEDTHALVWSGTPVSSFVSTRAIGLASAGDRVGRLEIFVGDELLQVPLELGDDIRDPGPWWRLTDPIVSLF